MNTDLPRLIWQRLIFTRIGWLFRGPLTVFFFSLSMLFILCEFFWKHPGVHIAALVVGVPAYVTDNNALLGLQIILFTRQVHILYVIHKLSKQ